MTYAFDNFATHFTPVSSENDFLSSIKSFYEMPNSLLNTTSLNTLTIPSVVNTLELPSALGGQETLPLSLAAANYAILNPDISGVSSIFNRFGDTKISKDVIPISNNESDDADILQLYGSVVGLVYDLGEYLLPHLKTLTDEGFQKAFDEWLVSNQLGAVSPGAHTLLGIIGDVFETVTTAGAIHLRAEAMRLNDGDFAAFRFLFTEIASEVFELAFDIIGTQVLSYIGRAAASVTLGLSLVTTNPIVSEILLDAAYENIIEDKAIGLFEQLFMAYNDEVGGWSNYDLSIITGTDPAPGLRGGLYGGNDYLYGNNLANIFYGRAGDCPSS